MHELNVMAKPWTSLRAYGGHSAARECPGEEGKVMLVELEALSSHEADQG